MSEHLKHMDIGSRNARICAKLQGMGLFVLPVFADDDPNRIDHMVVSVSPPLLKQRSKDAACAAIAAPMASADVGKIVEPAQPQRGRVIDFPSVRKKAHSVDGRNK